MTFLQTGLAKAAAGTTSYQIARSLRFNSADSAYLNRTPGTTSNQKTFTWSGWIKRGSLSSAVCIFGAGSSGTNFCNLIYSASTDTLSWFTYEGSTSTNLVTTQVFRDPSAWHHIVLSVDTTQATSTNRAKLYVNGVQITAFGTATYPAQNTNHVVNTSGMPHAVGAQMSPSAAVFFNGYMADVYFIDGQALDPTSFGQTDSATGVWMPKQVTGMTYGTNGFYLNFSDNSGVTATTLGKDSSGNSNNWTPNNFSVTAGVGNDSLVDSPTNYGTDTGVGGEVRGNYATLNPLDRGSDWTAVTNGNLDGTVQGPNGHSIRSTLAVSSGKWYWEFTNVNNCTAGIIEASKKIVPSTGSLWPGADGFGVGGSYAYRPDNGQKVTNSTSTAYGATFTTTDVIGCALDMDNGKIYWSKNGTWQGSGDPAAGTNAAFTGISGTFSPAWGYVGAGAGTLTCNFGQRPFTYTAPSGFKALCTQNLPTPAIGATSSTLASANFNVKLYTGNNNVSQTISGVGFQPDLIWIKNRDNVELHHIMDSVRGANKFIHSNNTNAERTGSYSNGYNALAFTSDGFSITNATSQADELNFGTRPYVTWAWKAGGTAVTNTSGTISSQVSVNTAAGISIVTFTGTGATATIGHGLGVAPAMIIRKTRSIADNWGVYHKSLGATNFIELNLTNGQTTGNIWGNTSPTSSVFTMNTSSTYTWVTYCFAEVAGFSKFGSYTGNGSTDGPFVYCGFRPKFVLVKNTDAATEQWGILDSARDTYNVANKRLYPNGSNAENTGDPIVVDFLSNGFKLRSTDALTNASRAYIFAAFAEAPFNYARAR